jgi:hypothetical protein
MDEFQETATRFQFSAMSTLPLEQQPGNHCGLQQLAGRTTGGVAGGRVWGVGSTELQAASRTRVC